MGELASHGGSDLGRSSLIFRRSECGVEIEIAGDRQCRDNQRSGSGRDVELLAIREACRPRDWCLQEDRARRRFRSLEGQTVKAFRCPCG